MKLKFDITPQEFHIVSDILTQYLPVNCKVWVFGSRTKTQAKFNSDLDLALAYKNQIPSTTIAQLKEKFSESDLPYMVDILDFNAVEPYFRDIINQKKISFPFAAKSQVPPLRFPGFSGEWEEKKLGDVGDFKGGGTPSKSVKEYWEGNIPWVSSPDINEQDIHNIKISKFINEVAIKESATKIIPKESVLFVSRVGVGKLAINTKEVCTSQDFTNLLPKNTSSYFLGYFFLAKNNLLIKYSQGTSIKGFTKNDIEALKLNLPTKPEQQKIAAFLTAVDNKIEQLSKKQALLDEYKKGLMQKIFSQAIRFKADDGCDFPDWEEKKLGDVLDYEQPTNYIVESMEYDDSFDTPVLTAGKSFILGYTNETQNIFEKLPVIIFDDFTTANKYVDFPFKIKSSAMKILKPKDNFINIRLVFEFIQMLHFPIREHKRYWISEYQDLKISFPNFEEQTKIANFLSSIDVKIKQVSKQLRESKQFKKALLQQMFV